MSTPCRQRKSATSEAELQRKSAQEENALYQHFDDAIKEKDAQVHALQHELSRLQEKQRIQLEAERFEAERISASTPVFADGPSTVRFATPVEKVTTVADFHSPDMSLGASAGNMNLKTRTAGQTMVINARRRLGMKTTPQPVANAAAKAEAHGVNRKVPKEEVRVRRTSLLARRPLSHLRKQVKSPLTMMTLRRRNMTQSMNGVRIGSMLLRRSKRRPLLATPLRPPTTLMSVWYMTWTMVNWNRWALQWLLVNHS